MSRPWVYWTSASTPRRRRGRSISHRSRWAEEFKRSPPTISSSAPRGGSAGPATFQSDRSNFTLDHDRRALVGSTQRRFALALPRDQARLGHRSGGPLTRRIERHVVGFVLARSA